MEKLYYIQIKEGNYLCYLSSIEYRMITKGCTRRFILSEYRTTEDDTEKVLLNIRDAETINEILKERISESSKISIIKSELT